MFLSAKFVVESWLEWLVLVAWAILRLP